MKANTALKTVDNWVKSNKLCLNYQKCNQMVINISSRPTDEIHLMIGSEPIANVKYTKILGVIVDQRLSFDKHIESICEKVNKRLHFLRRLRHYLPENTMSFLYKAIIQPNIDYGIS